MALQMYGFWRSQATFRVRVALNLKGIAYEEIPIDLDKGEQNGEAFRRINPLGGVPALMIDGQPLTQSGAILEYLEETYPIPALLPPDALGRARVRALAAIGANDTHPLIVPRIKAYLTKKEGFEPAQWKAWITHWLTVALQGYEARLAEPATGTYCHGDSPTTADICLSALYASCKTFGVEVADVPKVDSIVAHCMSQPAFEKAKASNQKDFPG